MKLTDFDTAIEVLLEAIRTDYREYTERGAVFRARQGETDGELTDVNLEMIEEFEEALYAKPGKKYVKIIKGGSVWGFVVAGDDKKFRVGDILKAAGWASPARNTARGNIFDGYTINWTGPNYT
jgi:hypothetical protein